MSVLGTFPAIVVALLFTLAANPLRAQEADSVVTVAEFQRRTADKDRTVLVYFHADWCLLCAKMLPVVQKVDSAMAGQLSVLSVDTERDRDVAAEMGIDALPMFMIYNNGQFQWVHVGLISEHDLLDELRMNPPPSAMPEKKISHHKQ